MAITIDSEEPVILGVLGCGYVGQQLLSQLPWHSASWYSVNRQQPSLPADLPYQGRPFNLDDPNSWQAVPQHTDWLVFTIPPGFQDRPLETQRLTAWCQWMAEHRPQIKRLIYLSTIGVYPEQPGLHTEQSPRQPSSLSGFLRLDSERILGQYFHTTGLRCGGIYGPNRNIVTNMLAGKAVYQGNKPLHRIHVTDLVAIIAALIRRPTAAPDQPLAHIPALNAVDDQPASQDEVIQWLSQQPGFIAASDSLPAASTTAGRFQPKRLDLPPDHRGGPIRVVSNQALSGQLGYALQYPSYVSGLAAYLDS